MKTATSQVVKAAIAYNKAGLSVIPIRLDGSKAPAIDEWGPLMKERPDRAAVAQLFAGDCGIAIVGGAVSGNLEIIDFDQEGAFEEWADLLEHIAPGLLVRLPVVKTPNGHHVYLRSARADGNQKLARSKTKGEGKKDNTKIETRGEGGYVIAPPSPANVHGSGREYKRIQGPKISEVPSLSDDERKSLFDTARSFNEVPEKEDRPPARSAQAAGRPGDDYEQKADWAAILEPHGWKRVRSRRGTTHWCRPGKSDGGISATTGYCGDKLYVFSSNADPFDSGRVYSKFTAYGRLNYGGDFAAAAAELSRLGYGEKRRNSAPPPPSDDDAPHFAGSFSTAAPDIATSGPPATRHLTVVGDPSKDVLTPDALEVMIAENKGAVCAQPLLSRLMAIRDSDLVRWAELEESLRRTKTIRHFNRAAGRSRVPRNVSPELQDAVREGVTSGREIFISTDLEEMNNEAVAAIVDAGAEVYQRDGRLVHIVSESTDNALRARGSPSIQGVGEERLRELMASSATWKRERLDKDGSTSIVLAVPPKDSARAILQRGSWSQVRRLVGVVEVPVLRPDGSVATEAGYDALTGVVYQPLLRVEIGDTTEAAAAAARDALLETVCDFPFESAGHRAAWLAAVLTPFARYAFDGPAPMFMVDANTRGSGKTLLATAVGYITEGRAPSLLSPLDNADEERKRITAIAIAGDRLAIIDNATSLGGVTMQNLMTSTRWKDRILGVSGNATVDLLTTWMATGNNVQLDGDMCRRVLQVRVESPDERPEDRSEFRHPNLPAWLQQNWPRLAGAALTILRGYFAAGRPRMPGIKTWGSYEGWCALVPHAVVWSGMVDPTAHRADLVSTNDTELDAVASFLRAFRAFEKDGCTAREMLTALANNGSGSAERELRPCLLELCPTRTGDLPTAVVLGKRLTRFRGRNVRGMRLKSFKDRHDVVVWRVELVDGQADLPLSSTSADVPF